MREDSETWEEYTARWQREEREKAERLWPKYKDRKPESSEKRTSWDGKRERVIGKEVSFDDGTKTTGKAEVSRTTTFHFDVKGKLERVYQRSSKSQLFLVVSGPLAGKRIKDENEDYVLFNRNGRFGKDVPKCVLVHKGSLGT